MTLYPKNQFPTHVVDGWCDQMWDVVPIAERSEITPEQWRAASLRALLEYWIPAGTC